jgi:hypothetical protein
MCHSTAQKFFLTYVPQEGTKYATVQAGTKCATARHKKTFRLMCHRKAHNVPQEGTKCATGRHKMCHSSAQKDLLDLDD